MGKATTTTLFLGVDPEVNGGLAVVAIVEGAATGVVSAPSAYFQRLRSVPRNK